MEAVYEKVKSAIDAQEKSLQDLGNEIWRNPEIGKQEIQSHKILTAFLHERGFEVEEHFVVPTGFRASFGKKDESNLHVCLLCEYDALPQLGHASGHNLVAEVCVAAAIGIKAGIESSSNKQIGKVTVLGTPDKDGAGSKTEMISNHAFDDVDFVMTVQPYMVNIARPLILQVMRVDIRYEGKTAHASCQPWEARNALDAAVLCYNNISVLRQQLKPNMQIHAIISDGGVRPNIIPGETTVKVFLRARDHIDMAFLTQRANATFVAAGKATGCETHFDYTETPYSSLKSNDPLASIYQRHAQSLGITFTEDCDLLMTSAGSTDTGNVSHIIPCILPTYSVGTDATYQSEAFAEAVGTEEAHKASIQVSKALSLTALEVMSNPEVMLKVKDSAQIESPTSSHNLSMWP